MPYDAIIIGGSFAGLSAAMQLARARRKILVVDGGKPRNRFSPASHGFLGQDGRPPREIMAEAVRQLSAYPTVQFFAGEAETARSAEGDFLVELADGREERAARLILATGLRDELPPIPGLPERWGVTVLHCPYCHGYEVADRPLGVLAGSALSTRPALMLPDWGPTTYFTQAKFELGDPELAVFSARGLTVETTPVVELLGNVPELEAVRLADGRVLPIGALFVAPKVHMASPIAEKLGCEFDEGPLGPFIRLDDKKQTTVPGIFAAGDAATPMHNATLASAAGVLAGVGAHHSLIPGL